MKSSFENKLFMHRLSNHGIIELFEREGTTPVGAAQAGFLGCEST